MGRPPAGCRQLGSRAASGSWIAGTASTLTCSTVAN